jgi:hypothetical protein
MMFGASLVFVLTGCNIFETRTPESPSQSSSTFVPATDPSLVFSNMVNSFRDLNSVNYLKSFADSSSAGRDFRFEPTQQAKIKYGGVFLTWSRQSEQQYFENLRSKIPTGSTVILNFETLTALSLQSDSAQYEVTYRLTAPHTVATLPTEATGKAQFFLIADRSRNWVVWRWIDFTTSTGPFSWSDLKGAFGQ